LEDSGEEDEEVLRSKEGRPLAYLDADDLLGRSYLSPPEEDGEVRRIKIVEALQEWEGKIATHPAMVRFRCKSDNGKYEEILSYNEILDKLEDEDGANDEWHFKSIDAHQGPLTPDDPSYKGSRWNVRVNWENGETTYEPLHIIAKSDPASCAIYAEKNGLLEIEGWKRFARLARRRKKLLRMTHQAKLQSFRLRPVYKFGVLVARNHDHAMELDDQNGNHKWLEAEKIELGQIDDYEAFRDLGKGGRAPPGYKRIRVHMVYDVKHDGRYKARLVAGGHLTDTPLESVYSSVVSLRGLRLAIFLGELNQMEVWATDIGNAYLEAWTKEKIYIVAGPEFGAREGHTLIIQKALYGLKSSGLRWWERFSKVLIEMGFVPSKAEDDLWMRDKGDHYEYIARYVDDLAIVSKNPASIVKDLTDTFSFKLKGTGPIDYHLGCNFFRDEAGTLCMAPRKYIERIVDNYVKIFGCRPRLNVSSPLERGDHPELDDSEELDEGNVKIYQSLIGALQWAVSIGWFDIAMAVMTLSKFCATPR